MTKQQKRRTFDPRLVVPPNIGVQTGNEVVNVRNVKAFFATKRAKFTTTWPVLARD